MKIVIDSKIPYIKGYAEQLGKTLYKAGASINKNDLVDADALIIRTRTHCNKALLEGTNVKFIATATIGYDHIDTAYLKEAGITWTNCPGCNANSVAQYVESCLLQLSVHGCWQNTMLIPATASLQGVELPYHPDFSQLTLGIVGVGHVGSAVLNMAKRLGFGRILLCDPPRAEREGENVFSTLKEVAQVADVITFHTPLTHDETSAYPTYHLADHAFFAMLKPTAVVINSSRGEVVDSLALKQALAQHKLRTAIIDTWENEPHIDTTLLNQVFIGTPHIAGYSADGKANGTRMSLQAVAQFFGKDPTIFNAVCPPILPQGYCYYPEGEGYLVAEELKFYDPVRDFVTLKQTPEKFEELRGNYPLRREMH